VHTWPAQRQGEKASNDPALEGLTKGVNM
jgi:hypothetical protein